jgi:hypothetical protein
MVMSTIYLVLRFVKEDVGKGTTLKRREKRGYREEIYVRPAENFCMYTMGSSRKNLNEDITTKDNVV